MSLVHFDRSFVTVKQLFFIVSQIAGRPVICRQFCFSPSISHWYSVGNRRLRFSGLKLVNQLSNLSH